MSELVCSGILARRCEGSVTMVEVDTGGHESWPEWRRMALCGACLEVAHRLYAVRPIPLWRQRQLPIKDMTGRAIA